MVLFVGVSVETLELSAVLEALLTEEEVVTVLTHPAVLQDLSFAGKALVALVFLHLRLKDHF